MIPLARFVPSSRGWIGRPSKDRLAIASAFVAKVVYGFTTTRQLLEALPTGRSPAPDLWVERSAGQVPHEATFSRAFDEFARMELPQFVHEALIRETQQDRLIGHIARDSTAIEAREHFPETPAQRAARHAARRAKLKEEREAARAAARKAAEMAGRPRAKGRPRGPHKRFPGGKRPYAPPSRIRVWSGSGACP